MSNRWPFAIVNIHAQFARISTRGAFVMWTDDLREATKYELRATALGVIRRNPALVTRDVCVMDTNPPGPDLTEPK